MVGDKETHMMTQITQPLRWLSRKWNHTRRCLPISMWVPGKFPHIPVVLVLCCGICVLGHFYTCSCSKKGAVANTNVSHSPIILKRTKTEQIHNEESKSSRQVSEKNRHYSVLMNEEPPVDVSKDGMTEIVIHNVRHIKRKNCTDVTYSHYPLPKTALASFPGSGNTWARHLIQLLSGVHTGSIYLDPVLKKKGFIAERNQNSSVIAIKTNYPRFPCCDTHKYERAILLIRRPREALLSEYILPKIKYKTMSQINRTRMDSYGWPYYVKQNSALWMEFQVYWLAFAEKKDIDLFLLFYDDLVTQLDTSLQRLATFLGVHLSAADRQCVIAHGEGLFHRRYLPGNNPYDNEKLDEKGLTEKIDTVQKGITECMTSKRCTSSGRDML